jgi:hypothetical protein
MKLYHQFTFHTNWYHAITRLISIITQYRGQQEYTDNMKFTKKEIDLSLRRFL